MLPRYESRQKLSEWADFFLEMRCDKCHGRSVVSAIPRLIQRYGNSTFRELLSKLKCRECGNHPSGIWLCASQHRQARQGGGAPDWSLELELRG